MFPDALVHYLNRLSNLHRSLVVSKDKIVACMQHHILSTESLQTVSTKEPDLFVRVDVAKLGQFAVPTILLLLYPIQFSANSRILIKRSNWFGHILLLLLNGPFKIVQLNGRSLVFLPILINLLRILLPFLLVV